MLRAIDNRNYGEFMDGSTAFANYVLMYRYMASVLSDWHNQWTSPLSTTSSFYPYIKSSDQFGLLENRIELTFVIIKYLVFEFNKGQQHLDRFMSSFYFVSLLPTAREGNVFRSMCHSLHWGKGVGQTPLSRGRPKGLGRTLGTSSRDRPPSKGRPPRGRTSPKADHLGTDIWWWPLQWLVCIPLECILVNKVMGLF